MLSDLDAQLEQIIVEKYYISDEKDASNTTGGILPSGSVTYRIFVDLQKGYKLTKVFGKTNRPITITSTMPFYNHQEDGVSTAYTINKNRFSENLIALDTWITLGQVTRPSGGSAYFGMPKVEDKDGSIIGGQNNDGGSAEVQEGLINNNDPSIGLPVTIADGMSPSSELPTNWFTSGLIDNQTGEDLSIFSSDETTLFNSEEFIIQNSGIKGLNKESNTILIAQLTTKGEISFKLNLEVEDLDGKKIVFVHNDTLLMSNEIFSSQLTYPKTCGCTDPNFLEYSTNFGCPDVSKCKTPIKYGCLDTLACNFDPTANYNIPTLCCYVGYCNDFDIQVVCPNLPPRTEEELYHVYAEPNPVNESLRIKHNLSITSSTYIDIYNSSNKRIITQPLSNSEEIPMDVSNFSSGYYFVVIRNSQVVVRNKFIKI
jgi:hypothetical protein